MSYGFSENIRLDGNLFPERSVILYGLIGDRRSLWTCRIRHALVRLYWYRIIELL
jgi:hypothetical protein